MLEVLYTCHLCGLKDQPVKIPYRSPTEDIRVWMDHLTQRLGLDHATRSPGCDPEQLHDVKIPMPAGTQYIGGPVEN